MTTQRMTLTFILILTLLAPGASQSLAQPAASPAAPASPTAPGSMLIVENAGQWPAAARFQVWNSPLGPGTTWLAEDAIWLVVSSNDKVIGNHPGGTRWQGDWEPSRRDTVTVRSDPITLSPPHPVTLSSAIALKLTFPGSNPGVRIEPFEPLTTTVSYFIGNDPEQWRPAVQVWGGVRYVNLYPGVDLVLGGQDAAWRLEAASGATTDQVRVQVEGAGISAMNGAMVQLDAAGTVTLPAASFTYQAAGLSLQGDIRTLAVQPDRGIWQWAHVTDEPGSLLYSTFLGGSSSDVGYDIAVDGVGNAYVTGMTYSSNFPTTPGVFDPSRAGITDAFVVKLNPTGSGLVYATFLGGSSGDTGWGIAVDGEGRAYVTGGTGSSDFPTTPGAFDTTHNGGGDVFVAKLNPTGSGLAYATFLGGSGSDSGSSITLHGTGRAYVAGNTGSIDFPITPGVFDPTFGGGICGTTPDTYPCYDAWVVKLNLAGSGLDYATFLGGNDDDYGDDIAVDATGNAYVTGSTRSADFPTTPGVFAPTFGGGTCGTSPNTYSCPDAFLAKVSPTGGTLTYSTYLGGSNSDFGRGIAVDANGSAYVTGETRSIDLPATSGAFDQTFGVGGMCFTQVPPAPPEQIPCPDGFLTKLNPSGSGLDYSTFLGSSSFDKADSIALDGTGNAYVTGYTASFDFPVTPGAFDTNKNGGGPDAFVAKLNLSGGGLEYSTFLGGNNVDFGYGIVVDATGGTYVAGNTQSVDFPTATGAFDSTFNGGVDAFVAKLNLTPYTPNVVAPIEHPAAGAFVSGAVTLRGYAIDRASTTGTGIDQVHIYLDGPYGTGTIIGGATYGLDRPDIAAQYGARFGPSGWELAWDTAGLAPGVHRLYLYAHRTTDNAWSLMEPHLVVTPGGPARWLPIVLRQR